MKKSLLVILMSLLSVCAFAADSFKVEAVTGKVQYESAPGTWKTVTVGQELSSSTVVNTSLNSNLVLSSGSSKVTIKAMQKGSISSLSGVAAAGNSGIKKGAVLNVSSVGADVNGTSKSVVTASSRASEAKEDIDWDEE